MTCPGAQIFALLAFANHPPADLQSSKFVGVGRRLAIPKSADELVESAVPCSDAAPPLHATAESTNSYAHAAADHFPVAQTFPRLRLHNHLPPHAAHA